MGRRKGIEAGGARKWLLAVLLSVLLAGTAAVFCKYFRYLISEQKQEHATRDCINACNHELLNRLNRKIDFSTSGTGEASTLIRPRRAFRSYEEYIELQLNKTLNPRLRNLWTSRDWKRKVDVFSAMFRGLMKEPGRLLRAGSKALCIGARVGQEVVALKEIGVADAIGIDLVPYPPLVIRGDMHTHPFPNNTFDFEFSNVFDHALYPSLFVSEIERTLKPEGVAVLHVAVHKRGDKYSANDLYSADPLIALFKNSTLVHLRRVDGFGLDTEIALRKNSINITASPVG
jgi:SAM-dependent methyltransferase